MWKETPVAPVLLFDPVLPLLLFDVLPSASVARVAAPAMDICFFQRNKVCFYFILCYSLVPACFLACALQSQQERLVINCGKAIYHHLWAEEGSAGPRHPMPVPYRAGPACFIWSGTVTDSAGFYSAGHTSGDSLIAQSVGARPEADVTQGFSRHSHLYFVFLNNVFM